MMSDENGSANPTDSDNNAGTAEAPKFLQVQTDDGEWGDNRSGPRLDRFSEQLTSMDVNQFFDIEIVKNARGKTVPKYGFNVKAANDLYGPDIQFKKRRMVRKDGVEVLRVKRVK